MRELKISLRFGFFVLLTIIGIVLFPAYNTKADYNESDSVIINKIIQTDATETSVSFSWTAENAASYDVWIYNEENHDMYSDNGYQV